MQYEEQFLNARHPKGAVWSYGFSFIIAWITFVCLIICGATFMICSRKKKGDRAAGLQGVDDEPHILGRMWFIDWWLIVYQFEFRRFVFDLLLPQIRRNASDFTSHEVRFVMMYWVPTSSTKKPYRIGKNSDYVRDDSFSSHKDKQWTSLNIKTMRLELSEDIKIKRDIQNLYICFCFFNQNNVEYFMKSEITYILHNEWEIFTFSIRNLFLPSLLCSAIEECNTEP